jgi:hypothetical protein
MTTSTDRIGPPVDDPHAALERALIAEFLETLGLTIHSVRMLRPDQQKDVLRFATTYATLRLSEIDARARYVDDIEVRSHHGVS